jgi:hypothetical protein
MSRSELNSASSDSRIDWTIALRQAPGKRFIVSFQRGVRLLRLISPNGALRLKWLCLKINLGQSWIRKSDISWRNLQFDVVAREALQ